ncbi:MAG: hypothetical protein AB1798_13310 [Spirochaetota bacterium]
MPFLRVLSGGIEAGYSLSPLKTKTGDPKSSLSLLSGSAVIGLNFELFPRFVVSLQGKGGYFYGFFNDTPAAGGGNPFVAGGAAVSYRIIPALSLGLEGSYRNYLGLYNDVQVALGTSLLLGGASPQAKPVKEKREVPTKPEPLKKEAAPEPRKEEKPELKGTGLDIVKTTFNQIFPVFFKYYDKNPIGKAVLHNFETVPVNDIKVTFFVKQYMDNPKAAPAPAKLGPGEEKEIDIFGLFTNAVLEITEGTKVSALITIEYSKEGQQQTKEHIETISINNRNAVTWDDDRKASAFVTAKDPAVMKFGKNVVGWIKSEQSRSVNKNLLLALGLHEALDLYGLTYVIDPTTPYIEFSENELAIDYLQFPKQTMEFMAGDCDDLSILYSALLESVGIETAFVTTPGHIFVAFALELAPDEARKTFLYPDDLIFREGKSWLPVEITTRGSGFLKAWQVGAKEWRENASKNLSGFFPMHPAWELYEPVGFPGTPNISMPDKNAIVTAFKTEVSKFIGREIYPQESKLLAELKRNQGDERTVNKLGVLYARYDLDEKAEEQFQKILKTKEYLPALLNMGNLYYLKADLKNAQMYYKRAEKVAPDNPKVLLSVARIDHELENYGTARATYSRLKDIDPLLANQFAYLDLRGEEASRAADAAQVKGVVVWAED